MMITGLVMQASFMTMEDQAKGKELEALFKKHGFDEDSPDSDEPGGDEMVDFSKLTDDLPAFVGDLSAWIKANEPDPEGGFPKLESLSNVKIEGDTATAMTSTEMGEQPIEFRKVDGSWKINLATGPGPEPTVDELGLDFDDTRDGTIGWLQLGDKSSGLNHAFAFNAKFFDEPCIMLVLTKDAVTDQQQKELEEDLKAEDGNAMFFADGPSVKLTLTPEGEIMAMHVWIDNSSLSGSRGPAIEFERNGDSISGRVGMAPEEYGDEVLQFQAKFETDDNY
jgi:hypothetical protein